MPIGLKCQVRHVDTDALYEVKLGSGFPVEGGVALLFPDAFDGPLPPPTGLFDAIWLELPHSFTGEMEDAWLPIVVDRFTWNP